MQPPSDQDDRRNPYAMPSAWGRTPAPVFKIGPLPKAGAPLPREPRAMPAPAPAPRGGGILRGSALPVGPARPQPKPAPAPVAEVAPAPEPEVAPAPAFVAPRRETARKPKGRVPLIAGGAVAALVVGGVAIAMLNRSEPAPVTPAQTYETPVVQAPVESTPVAESVEQAALTPVQPAATAAPMRTTPRPAATPTVTAELPAGPTAYAPQGTVATPAPQPQITTPEPIMLPPPPAPQIIIRQPVDPNAPLVTRDPTAGD
jgi:hypothetical protein